MLGRKRRHTLCGLLMHSSLAVTTDGLLLGMAAIKFWTRKKFKDKATLKRKVNSTRVPIEGKESMRWQETLRHSTELLGAPGPGRQAGLSHLSLSPSSGSGLLRLRWDSSLMIDAVSIVDDAVEDRVSDLGFSDHLRL